MRYPMNMALRLPPSATPHRIGRFYTGRPSWRTHLRRLRRRLGKKELPRNDEERLLDAARKLRREQCIAGMPQEPVRALRIVRRLPLVFLAADGRTTFRYVRASKNASTSMLYMLLQITGEAAYYPWDESRHFLTKQRTPEMCVLQKGEDDGWVVINDAQMRLRQYTPLPYCGRQTAPLPDIRFCLVRDPVERFVSACQGLVFRPYRDASRSGEDIRRAGLAAQSRPHFLDMDAYIAIAEAQKQTPQSDLRVLSSQKRSLGGHPDYYTHIFAVRQLARVRDFLSELMQKPLALPNINRTRRKREILAEHPAARGLDVAMPPLTAQQRQRIEELYAEDYEAFGKYF